MDKLFEIVRDNFLLVMVGLVFLAHDCSNVAGKAIEAKYPPPAPSAVSHGP